VNHRKTTALLSSSLLIEIPPLDLFLFVKIIKTIR